MVSRQATNGGSSRRDGSFTGVPLLYRYHDEDPMRWSPAPGHFDTRPPPTLGPITLSSVAAEYCPQHGKARRHCGCLCSDPEEAENPTRELEDNNAEYQGAYPSNSSHSAANDPLTLSSRYDSDSDSESGSSSASSTPPGSPVHTSGGELFLFRHRTYDTTDLPGSSNHEGNGVGEQMNISGNSATADSVGNGSNSLNTSGRLRVTNPDIDEKEDSFGLGSQPTLGSHVGGRFPPGNSVDKLETLAYSLPGDHGTLHVTNYDSDESDWVDEDSFSPASPPRTLGSSLMQGNSYFVAAQARGLTYKVVSKSKRVQARAKSVLKRKKQRTFSL